MIEFKVKCDKEGKDFEEIMAAYTEVLQCINQEYESEVGDEDRWTQRYPQAKPSKLHGKHVYCHFGMGRWFYISQLTGWLLVQNKLTSSNVLDI